MSFDSNPRCLDRNCSFSCCDISGVCPNSPSFCHYYYNSYYCFNNCTSQYYYSSNTCSTTCSNQASLNQGLIYGCIFGSFFFILIVSSIILYKCNKRDNNVTVQVEANRPNQSSSLDDNSLSTINDGELHSVMNKKQAKENKADKSASKIVERNQLENIKRKRKELDKKKAQIKIQKTKESNIIQQQVEKKQTKPTYGKVIPLQRKVMIPDFSF